MDKWPDPTPQQLASPLFDAIWWAIKDWDINVPFAYNGYCKPTGNHVRAIMDAIIGKATQAFGDPPIEELAGLKPLVLYFKDEDDRQELIRALEVACPGMVEHQIP